MRRRVIQVKMRLLDTLTVVSLRIAQAKEPLLEEIILLVPEGKCHVLNTMRIRDTGNAVLTPAIGSGASLVVREMRPGVAVRRVVLSDGCPLPLSNVGTPFLPVLGPLTVFFQALLFLAEVFVMINDNHGERGRSAGPLGGSSTTVGADKYACGAVL